MQQLGGDGGVEAEVGELARAELNGGQFGERENVGAAGGGRELVEGGGQSDPSWGVVTGLEVMELPRSAWMVN